MHVVMCYFVALDRSRKHQWLAAHALVSLTRLPIEHTWYQLCRNVDQHIETRKQVIDIRILRVKEDAHLMLHCQFGDLY